MRNNNNNTKLLVILAAIALAVGLWLVSTMNGASDIDNERTDVDAYSRVCRVPTEDSEIPSSCVLDPAQHYTYDGGAWVAVPDYTYANGNHPPTGAELMTDPPGDQ